MNQKLFSGRRFKELVSDIFNDIDSEINSQTEEYILNVGIDSYVDYLVQMFKLDFPELNFNNVFIDTQQKAIPWHVFPNFNIKHRKPDETIVKDVIIYHIPYSGDINLIQYKPNPYENLEVIVSIDNSQNCILIDIINFYNDANKIRNEYENKLQCIKNNYFYLRENINSFNLDLIQNVKNKIALKRKQIFDKYNLLQSLGVPLKKRENVSETFSIPSPRLRDKIIVKPIVTENNFIPEPTLDVENYWKILKIINDIGRNFERMPSTYKNKSEEDIRDMILFVLAPNFEYGNAGGETFNKSGKTDISLRYDSSVVFVAECKYWRGEKVFIDTLNQLLNYLTWRDSKVAVINFVQTKDIIGILEKIKISIQTHSNFIRIINDRDENWFNYKFHLNEDKNREIDLAVISIHVPL